MANGFEINGRDAGAARRGPADALRSMSAASVVEVVPVPVAIVAEGEIVYANPALSTLLARPPAGERLAAVVEEAAVAVDAMSWLEGASRRPVTLLHDSGRRVPARLTSTVHLADGIPLAFAVFDDATDRVWMGELTG